MDSVALAEEARGEPGYALLTLLSLLGWTVDVQPCSSGVIVRARLPGECCVSKVGAAVADVAVGVFMAAVELGKGVGAADAVA